MLIIFMPCYLFLLLPLFLQVAHESGASLEEVQKEAASILEEMGHNLNLRSVRFFAYFLIKVFKSLFRRVYVNEEGVQRVSLVSCL